MCLVHRKGITSGKVDHSCCEVDRIIFCVFLEIDYKIFKKKMGEFFPLGRLMVLAIWLVFACMPRLGRQRKNLTSKAKGKRKDLTEEGILFSSVNDANEEGTELSEETGLEQKGQTPSPTKSKAEQPEDLQDDAEDLMQCSTSIHGQKSQVLNIMPVVVSSKSTSCTRVFTGQLDHVYGGGDGTAEKQNADETEAQSREADETKPSAAASLSPTEDTELSEDKDSLKDSKGTRESDPVHPVACEQDQAEGQLDVSAKEEMKTGSDSQSSWMEIEETLLNQEDTTDVEAPLIPGAEEKEEGKEEGGMQGQEESSVEPMKIDLASEAAAISNKDAPKYPPELGGVCGIKLGTKVLWKTKKLWKGKVQGPGAEERPITSFPSQMDGEWFDF
ncbi:O-acetyl-ADP-ribose deacetylase MACROD2 [Pitangus sulphuratus]|nr:O-acetyl-ADP-ribose deacetylase MACROD2 [Pitangus sulphuratus]